MKQISGFIVSSPRTGEYKASIELSYFLSHYLEYENVEVNPSEDISGLSIATFSADPITILSDVENQLEKDPSVLKYTLKLVPFNYKVETDLDEINKVAAELAQQIEEKDTWRISLRKRHTDLSREEIIDTVAKEFTSGEVDLEEPDYYVIVEILGTDTYLGVFPKHEISLDDYVDDVQERIGI